MNRRHAAISLLALSIAPHFVKAQQRSKIWRVGFLTASAKADNVRLLDNFRGALRELGNVEGTTYVLEPRFGNADLDQLTSLAAELVRLKVDIIISVASRPAVEIRKASTEIPIVLLSAGDPVGAGLVKNLGRPEGNVTGTSNSLTDIAPKHVELLLDTVPKLSRLAVLMNPAYRSHRDALKTIQALGSRLNLQVLPIEAGSTEEIERGFLAMAKHRAEAFIVVFDPIFDARTKQIAELAVKGRLPSVAYASWYADAGCLMSYGADPREIVRRTAAYVDRIFKGATPAELPIEQPTKFELVINLRTAKALGLKIPQSVLLRANRVIE